MSDPIQHSPSSDAEHSRAWLLTAGALSLTVAVSLGEWIYRPVAFTALALSLGLVAVAVWGPRWPALERIGRDGIGRLFWLGLAIEAVDLFAEGPCRHLRIKSPAELLPYFVCAVAMVLIGAAVLRVRRPRWRAILVSLLAGVLLVAGSWMIRASPNPLIDVFIFNRQAGKALLNGRNPYTIRFTNIYGDDSPFYAPGVSVNGVLQFSYPYQPLGIVMALPATALGDHRYAHLLTIAAAGILMFLARPGRLSAGAAVLFLLMPRTLFILENSWTEPMLVLLLAAVVFAAVRIPAVAPICFGLLLAGKQYMLLIAPAILLWRRWPNRRGLLEASAMAALCALVVTVPFILWNPHRYWISVVQLHLRQPFRDDSISFLALFNLRHPAWTACSFAAAMAAMAVAWFRLPRSASSFAAAVAFVFLVFFSLNKQAFVNYYYFVIAALWLAVASAEGSPTRTTTEPGPVPAS